MPPLIPRASRQRERAKDNKKKRSKTAEVLGTKTPATKQQKNKITTWAKRTKRKGGKKHNQQTRRQKIFILNSQQPENNQRQQMERTRSETARRKDSIKKKVTKRQQQFRLKNNEQNKNNAGKNAKQGMILNKRKHTKKKTATKQRMHRQFTFKLYRNWRGNATI